ncbi:hypothetical protein, partial [Paenibacillus naphthalenovorans]|uniref:hypothetical protein n=1 Tax=Paenibacillus naphthalenovorans TaxID=162209 RepID=UPI003D28F626
MDIKIFIDELLNTKNPSSSYVMIETLIFKVLSQVFQDNNKELITNYRIKNKGMFEFDAYAPDGFSEYEGATVFEIKLYRNKNSLRMIHETYNRLLNVIKSSGVNVQNIILNFESSL